ncbi:MAG: DUF5700 domain-containing putative Zn-dependent protease [Candidatus Krumholzibacteriota bacterium]
MITHGAARHNAATRRSLVIGGIVLLLSLTLAACSGETGSAEKQEAPAKAKGDDCRLTTDISGWAAFTDIADRVAAKEDVPRADFDAFAELPSIDLWRQSLDTEGLTAQRIANWVEGVFWDDLGRQGSQKRSRNRSDYLHTSNYCLRNRDRIDARLAELTGPRKCEMDQLIRYWVDQENLPADLSVHFFPAKPEIRILDGALFVDTGVLAAGSVDQIIRNTASLHYRKHQTIPGADPKELVGEQSVAHSFRILANEGVTGWIDKAAHLEFDDDHPSLHKVNIIPEGFFRKTQEAIGMMNRQLEKMLDDEADMAQRGLLYSEHLAAMNAYGQTGYGMAAVISHRLGEDRLREASRSVPGFLAAYQEAALLNPVPAPVPGTAGIELFETVPPLNPDLFTKLHAMLTRVFPE